MTKKMKSFVMGILLGMVGRAKLPQGEAEPVAYLYNGVRLPKLPEWDKETYPYAVIDYNHIYDDDPFYELQLYSSMTTTVESGELGSRYYVKVTGSFIWIRSYLNRQPSVWAEPYYGNYNSVVMEPTDTWQWSNTDILNPDGSVHFAASEPVPVYE